MTDKTSAAQRLPKNAWISVPLIAFAGIIIGIILPFDSFLKSIGIWGCVISSFILCGIALLKPKRDLVSLLVPLFAILIFNPWSEYSSGPIMQILFAATITVIAIRLEKKYS